MVGGLAGGALPAHVGVRVVAGVAALELDAGLVRGAVGVLGTLGVASERLRINVILTCI